jgi:hypothetical protein
MATSVATATETICGPPTELSEPSVARMYRLRKSFAAVQFDATGKGRIVFLPEGAELRLIGYSRLCECFEVTHESRLYNMFKVDLLGFWSTPIRPPASKALRAVTAARACA